MKFDLRGALHDIAESFGRPYLWLDLAWFDIKQRFRRSVLGPVWITISMAMLIIGMGPLYASIFDIDLKSYLPYLAFGIIIWSYISTNTIEACNSFILGTGVIQQTRYPLSSFVLRTTWRNLIILGFNSVLILAILIYVQATPNMIMLKSLLGLLLLFLATIGLSFIVAIFCTRYRDMQQLINSLLQIVMFVTPVFWRTDLLPQRTVLIDWNPAYYFLEAIRAPLMGKDVDDHIFIVAGSITSAFLVVGLLLFAKYRTRIVYWL